MRRRAAATLLAAALLAGGCAGPKILVRPSLAEDQQQLEEDLDLIPPLPRPAPASGSLWTEAGPAAALARDTRAYRINDLVRVVLQESTVGQNDSTTDLTRSSSADIGASIALGLEDADPQTGRFNLNQALQSNFGTDFQGDGSTARSNLLTANITARVMRVLPNGDLMLAGQKTVMVNREKQILTLVGTVRAVDIDSANRVPSSVVGDLTVRLWGQGEVDDTARQGWFMRVFNRIWPF